MSKRAARTTKAFKSGNSIAVRLPASFGVAEGTEMRVREEQGRYIVEPVTPSPKPKIKLRDVVGRSPGMEPLPREDFDDPPRDWHVLEKFRKAK
jgi:antitoxin VapB